MFFIKKNLFYVKVSRFIKKVYYKLTPYLSDTEKELIYVHIGKCGGGTLRKALKKSPIIRKKFNKFTDIHIRKPPIKKKAKYIILLRNPLERSISAFNYQIKLMKLGSDDYRFKHEHKILNKYKNLNNLAKKIIIKKKLNLKCLNEFNSLHHIRYNLDYYLNDLLKNIKSEQIFAVFSTENLDDEIKQKLKIINKSYTRKNNIKIKSQKKLSNISKINLRRVLKNEYKMIDKLSKLYDFKKPTYLELIK